MAFKKNEAGSHGFRAEWQEVALVLKQAFRKKKALQRGHSLGVLSRRLKVSVPFLSQLFNGKRALPVALVEPLSRALDLDLEKRDFLYRRLLDRNAGSALSRLVEPPTQTSLMLAAEWNHPPTSAFWLLEEWFYLPLLNCTTLPIYDGQSQTLARLLELPLEQVDAAMARFRLAGLLEEKDGVWRKLHRLNDFHSGASKDQIRAFHRGSLRRAEHELINRTAVEDLERRFITTLSFTVAAENIGIAKQRIADFLRQLTLDLTAPRGSEVYQLGVQFFPVARGEERPESTEASL